MAWTPTAAESKILRLLSASDMAQARLGVALLETEDGAELAQRLAEGINYHDGVISVGPTSMIAKRCKAGWRYVVALKVLAVLGRHKEFDSLSLPPRCVLSDLSPLEHYGHLKSLTLPPPAVDWNTGGQQTYELDALKVCSGLRTLALPAFDRAAEHITQTRAMNPHALDISALVALESLDSLDLSGAIVDAEMLAAILGLRRLVLTGSVVRNPSAIALLPKLEYLNLDHAILEGDIAPLVDCPAVTEVILKQCRIVSTDTATDAEPQTIKDWFKAIQAAAKRRKRAQMAAIDPKEDLVIPPGDRKKIGALLKSGDPSGVSLACEIMRSISDSPQGWREILTPAVMKSLVRRWNPEIWRNLTAITTGCSDLAAALETMTAEQFGTLATTPQNRILSSMLTDGTAAGDRFVACVRGVLKKFIFLELETLSAAAANELVSHPGWDLSVTTKQPLSDEVLEILCGCRSARLHLPSLSPQSVGPPALAALQTRGLG